LKTPVRRCVACRASRPKAEMIRVGAAGGWRVTRGDVKLQGRGAYVCPSEDCTTRARERGCIDRALHAKAPQDVYETIELLSRESK
jgi:predicted RNA-binding protein YlxR (DUF448 family)